MKRRIARGHPSVFTDAQNDALRAAMRELRDARHFSQAALGKLLGINQQNACRLLRDRNSGFSYLTATRLARVLGYAGVDAFFRRKGVTLPSCPPPATGTDD